LLGYIIDVTVLSFYTTWIHTKLISVIPIKSAAVFITDKVSEFSAQLLRKLPLGIQNLNKIWFEAVRVRMIK